MTAPATALLLSLLHATLVIVAAMIVRMCIARRLAAGRVTVGVIGMTCLLVVTALSFFPVPGIWPMAEPAPLAMQNTSAPADEPGKDSAATELDATANRGQTELSAGIRWPLDSLKNLVDRLERTSVGVERSSHSWKWSLLAIFLSGSAISLIRLCLALRSVAGLRRGSRPVVDDAIGRMLDGLKQACGCRRAIELRESGDLSGVATFGWLRPVILLPSDWPTWSHEELAAALAHEIAHVHRADYAGRLLAFVGAAIHFYHPLVRRAVRQLAMDQEFAADRLARELAGNDQAYTRGLARLALRYHDSLMDSRAWSNVSIMPRSSDFLARRLEMLRDKKDSIGKRKARLITCGASACLVAVALTTALLRGATAADEKPASDKPAAEVARLESRADDTRTLIIPTDPSDLFSREQFDLSMIHQGESGAFLLRVGEFMRHTQLEVCVADINDRLSAGVRETLKMPKGVFEFCEIEWIAGDSCAWTGPSKKAGATSEFRFASQRIVLRMNHAANWQEFVLKNIPGSSLENYQGQSYVRLPVIPEFGPVGVCLRFPNETTILSRLNYGVDTDGEAKAQQKFFDDTPQSYDWASTWHAVDGGMFTLVFDNRKVGWSDLQNDKDWPPVMRPLVEKTKYFASGWDWSEKTNISGFQFRCTCAGQDNVDELQQAAAAYVNAFMEETFPGTDPAWTQYNELIRHYFSQIKIEASAADSADQFIHTFAWFGPELQAPWDPHVYIYEMFYDGGPSSAADSK